MGGGDGGGGNGGGASNPEESPCVKSNSRASQMSSVGAVP